MAKISKHTFIKKVKDVTLNGTLAIALIGNMALFQSCRTASNADEGDYEEVETYTLGVKTYITETEKGVFKITNEEEVAADSSKAIVTYIDGRVENISPEAAKAMIDDEIKNNGSQIGQRNHLSNALLYGGMGYMLSRSLRPNYGAYRQDNSSSGYAGTYGRYYSSPNVYEKSTAINNNIGNSRTITTRPMGAKSGYFSSSRQSSFRG
jgi:hypothetical protein